MAADLLAYVQELQQQHLDVEFEPELDDKDEKTDRKLRELDDLEHGAVLKGTVQPGEGTSSPVDGDLVYFHITARGEDQQVLYSTRREHDGAGYPKVAVLGKGQRTLRGVELAMYDMKKRERAMLRLWPQYAYGAKGWHESPPGGVSPDHAMTFDVQLLEWYPGGQVAVVGEAGQVLKRTLQEGKGWETPRPPFEVHINIKARAPSTSGRHQEGTPYFATPEGKPLQATLGSGALPRGLETGLGSVTRGELAVLSVPAELAAGGQVVPEPPDGAERVEFEVELLRMMQVRDMTGDGQVTKQRIKEGVGEFPIDCPLEDSSVRVHIRGVLPSTGEVFLDTRCPSNGTPGAPMQFDTGMGVVPEAVDMAVRLMTVSEVSVVHSSAKYAYDYRPDRPQAVPEGADVEFEIELVGFNKQPNWYQMPPAAKISRSHKLREQGNRLFRAGQWARAKDKYTKALKIVDRIFDIETEEEAREASGAKASCMLNLSACALKQQEFGEALKWADKALQEVPSHVKALHRRAAAHIALGDYSAAEEDYKSIVAADPSSEQEVERALLRMRQRQKAAEDKQRAQFKNFFAKKLEGA